MWFAIRFSGRENVMNQLAFEKLLFIVNFSCLLLSDLLSPGLLEFVSK